MLPFVQRNYRLYLLLITLALAFYTCTLTFSARRIRVQLDAAAGAGLLGLLRSWPEMVALAAFSSVAVWLLACLLAYHVFLAAKNQVPLREILCGLYAILLKEITG
jgi:palmitoyltransferase ZDHHC9/14/18